MFGIVAMKAAMAEAAVVRLRRRIPLFFFGNWRDDHPFCC